jgi:TolB-like protein/Flp pilus assembly protein TadD
MNEFIARLKQRKLVQWAIAYVAGAWAVLQALGLAAESYDWPHRVMQIAFAAIAVGFVVTLLLAWYHGEQGRQRVSGTELLLIALVLALGGGLLWHFGRPAPAASAAAVPGAVPNAAKSMPQPGIASVPIAAQPIPAKSIAVLPFENLSTDKGNAYFADGIQDLILTKLADIGDLKVISRTSTAKYASHPDDLKTIGRQLGVATILEGSVQKAGNQVLINVQLIDARTDSHIWAETYRRTLTDIFGVEGEVAQKVADALKAKLTATESQAVARVLTKNPEAYTLYLKAKYESDQFLNGDGQPAHQQRANRDLKQAIALDPEFAAAYAELARIELGMYEGRVEDPDASLTLAEANARKALALQADLVDGYIALGHLLLRQARYGQALDAIQTAARLAPGNADAAFLLGAVHVETGDLKQGLADFSKALSLDPRAGTRYLGVATIQASLRRYDDARQTLQRGLAISPNDQLLHARMAWILLLQGDLDGARAQLEPLPLDARGRPALMANAWWLARDYQKTLAAARQIPQRNVWSDAGNREGWTGMAYVGLGDLPRAQAAFKRARDAVMAEQSRHPGKLLGQLAWIEMWSGHKQAALHAIDEALREAHEQSVHSGEPPRQRGQTGQAPRVRTNPVVDSPRLYEGKAEILAHFGDAEGAVAILRQLFESPGTGLAISPALLRLDPVWDPIRKDPSFQALLNKYGNVRPTASSSGGAP